MKPTLFVDFDRTICFDRFWRSVDPKIYTGIQEVLFRGNAEKVDDWMRGKHSSEEINKFLADELNAGYDDLWSVFVSDCKSMKVSADVLKKIDGLRARYNTILITGNMDCFTRFTVPALELDNYFDQIVNSADYGRFKDDDNGRIFLDILKEFGGNIKDSILIDNSETTCKTFSNLGGKSLQVTKNTPIEHWLNYLSNSAGT
ncbi:hypothetical protein A2215_03735 [Candidatus Berkelbacteria bacterium RIFOXYA2_FULL_43_10]|uniref:Haloacid dehalogenase n=1 Tax=Candidatus Berkelbacteria bacterium RIFOXYA2_FULL_43_10 TaxID=1797472 RepID=A0A1F5E4S3_9BACT|nr:MAG: hypothetical protein A2215_03735 [Candidatus Berkelbacteria bacterium RIFOXYA2_FULL_43_10]